MTCMPERKMEMVTNEDEKHDKEPKLQLMKHNTLLETCCKIIDDIIEDCKAKMNLVDYPV